jgi:hypothetical protein
MGVIHRIVVKSKLMHNYTMELALLATRIHQIVISEGGKMGVFFSEKLNTPESSLFFLDIMDNT